MRVYTALAQSKDSLPAGTIRGIHRWAKQQKDATLLATLAGRTDLPDDVLTSLGKESTAKVRVAYLSRPDRSPEELATAVAKEKRVTILTAVAESPEASGPLLEALGEVDNARVRKALLHNDNTPSDVCAKALRAAWKNEELDTWSSASLFKDRPQFHEVAIACLDVFNGSGKNPANYVGAELIGSTHISPASQRVLVKVLVHDPIVAAASQTMRYRANPYMIERSISALLSRPVLAPEALEALRLALATPEAAAVFSSSSLTGFKRQLEKRSGSSAEVDQAQQRLDLARDSRDPAVLEQLGKELLAEYEREESDGRTELVGAIQMLCGNPATTDETILPLVKALPSTSAHAVLQKRGKNAALVVEVLDRYIEYANRGGLDQLEDPAAVVNELAIRVSRRENSRRGWQALFTTGLISKESYRLVPWTIAEELNAWHGTNTSTLKLLAELLDETLGDDAKAWEMFSTLGENSSGTVGDLLETTHILAAGA